MRRAGALVVMLVALRARAADRVRLPTGAGLDPAAVTHELGNMPLAMAVAPGGDRLVVLLSGWRQQGIQVVDRASGNVLQTLEQPAAFIGLAFAPDGKSVWTSGGNEDAVYRYSWLNGTAALDRRIALAPKEPKKPGTRYPAGLAFSPDGKRLLVAENLSDTLAVVDVAGGKVIQRLRAGRYPYGVAVSRSGDVYVSAWGDHSVVRFRPRADGALRRDRRIVVARHPSALLLDEKGKRLYVASASTDQISVVDTIRGATIKTLADHPPGGPHEGSTPNALALSKDGKRLFVAEADNNAVAVFALSHRTSGHTSGDRDTLIGRIPCEWYPSAVAVEGGELFVVAAKGGGTGPNPRNVQSGQKRPAGSDQFTLGQLRGSLMSTPAAISQSALRAFSQRVARANGWNRTLAKPSYPPLRHVLYVIKENRTYDQVLGDLSAGDGDASLVYFPREVSPNHHALAERFGLFDRFFVNAEVSSDGHNWSTAAYATDYVEKTTPSHYSDRGRTYDYEGTNREVIVDDDDDVNAPATGYLWDLAVRKGISLRNYGEFVVKTDEETHGQQSTRRALAETTNLSFPGWNLDIPDQRRADVWIAELQEFSRRGEMPALQIIRLPNDHTSGGAAGKPTPRAHMADNDLALGRIVDALSHSPFWKDSVMFVLEDDSQNGPDHVDSHRSPLLVISPYNRGGVVHRFANTTDVLATIEEILGLDSLSQFDFYGRPLRDIFTAEPDLRPYDALEPAVNRQERNPPNGEAAQQSLRLDLHTADAADEELFNRILWRMMKGNDAPFPAPRRAPAGAPWMTR